MKIRGIGLEIIGREKKNQIFKSYGFNTSSVMCHKISFHGAPGNYGLFGRLSRYNTATKSKIISRYRFTI